jgi:DNA adenine methylase
MNRVTRPLLKYHGGKWLLGPWIRSYFPPHRIYVEPFGGGGSILLQKNRCFEEVYNDLDEEVVNLFRIVRDRGDELLHKIELTPYSRVEHKLSMLETDDPLERARRLIVRSFMGRDPSSATRKDDGTFKGRQSKAWINCAQVWMGYPDALKGVIKRLRGVIIETLPAVEVIKKHDGPETLFYVDPPYLPETRDKGRDYRHEMTEADHKDLAEVLNHTVGTVVLSGYPSKLYDELYKGWLRKEVGALADGGFPRTEVLWMKGVKYEPELFEEEV